jgi:hypothetical protein
MQIMNTIKIISTNEIRNALKFFVGKISCKNRQEIGKYGLYSIGSEEGPVVGFPKNLDQISS